MTYLKRTLFYCNGVHDVELLWLNEVTDSNKNHQKRCMLHLIFLNPNKTIIPLEEIKFLSWKWNFFHGNQISFMIFKSQSTVFASYCCILWYCGSTRYFLRKVKHVFTPTFVCFTSWVLQLTQACELNKYHGPESLNYHNWTWKPTHVNINALFFFNPLLQCIWWKLKKKKKKKWEVSKIVMKYFVQVKTESRAPTDMVCLEKIGSTV